MTTACARHPGTQTGLRCSRCETPICPDCLREAATGFHCPDCAREDRRTMPKVRRAAEVGGMTPATRVLLATIALGFLATAAQGGVNGGVTPLHGDFAFYAPAVADGEWWRVVTHGFLHYGVFHLLMNGYALWVLGPMVESRLGTARFVLLWVVGGLGAAAGASLVEPTGLAAGASGSIFGLLAAAVVLERRRGIRDLLGSQVGLWLGYGLLITFLVPGISVGGHLGGAAVGAVASFFLFTFDRHGTQRYGVLAATAVGLCALGVTAVGANAALDSFRAPQDEICALLAAEGLSVEELTSIGC